MNTNEPEDSTFKIDEEKITLKRDNVIEFLGADRSLLTILDSMQPGEVELIGTHILKRVA